MDRSSSLVVEHATHDKSTGPGCSTAHLANLNQQRSRAKAAFDKVGAPKNDAPRSSASASPGSTDSRDYPGGC